MGSVDPKLWVGIVDPGIGVGYLGMGEGNPRIGVIWGLGWDTQGRVSRDGNGVCGEGGLKHKVPRDVDCGPRGGLDGAGGPKDRVGIPRDGGEIPVDVR